MFSEFLAQNGESILAGKKVLELGSGPGLSGFHAAHWASEVIVTDYQDLVLELLQHNIQNCNPSTQCQMFTCRLDWCADDNLNVPLLDIDSKAADQLTNH